MKHPFVIAEVGINHNGDLEIAKKLITLASLAGFDAVKFQKRTVDEVYTPEELDRLRESPFGTTYREQKEGLEFGLAEYQKIDTFCKERGIEWLASAWDLESQDFLKQFDLKYNKVASPMLTVEPLLHAIAKEGKHTFISTGMSTLEEIDRAVDIFKQHNCPFELMHCNSTYPSDNKEANLRVMGTLKERYGCDIGYSGHERGYQVTLAAVALGATSVERHITLDRSMYGSDQAASLGVTGFTKMVRDIRTISMAMGDGIKRVYDGEKTVREKLATPYWYAREKNERT